jgi:predicted GTPase
VTKDVRNYATVVENQSVTLVDTPGFNDTELTDRQVLERISTYLYERYVS